MVRNWFSHIARGGVRLIDIGDAVGTVERVGVRSICVRYDPATANPKAPPMTGSQRARYRAIAARAFVRQP